MGPSLCRDGKLGVGTTGDYTQTMLQWGRPFAGTESVALAFACSVTTCEVVFERLFRSTVFDGLFCLRIIRNLFTFQLVRAVAGNSRSLDRSKPYITSTLAGGV